MQFFRLRSESRRTRRFNTLTSWALWIGRTLPSTFFFLPSPLFLFPIFLPTPLPRPCFFCPLQRPCFFVLSRSRFFLVLSRSRFFLTSPRTVETKANLRNRRGQHVPRTVEFESTVVDEVHSVTHRPLSTWSSWMTKVEVSEAQKIPSRDKELEHDVESDIAEETMSATVRLAKKKIDEPYDVDLPTAECCQSRTPSQRRLDTR